MVAAGTRAPGRGANTAGMTWSPPSRLACGTAASGPRWPK
jgi:hypothetical protein